MVQGVICLLKAFIDDYSDTFTRCLDRKDEFKPGGTKMLITNTEEIPGEKNYSVLRGGIREHGPGPAGGCSQNEGILPRCRHDHQPKVGDLFHQQREKKSGRGGRSSGLRHRSDLWLIKIAETPLGGYRY